MSQQDVEVDYEETPDPNLYEFHDSGSEYVASEDLDSESSASSSSSQESDGSFATEDSDAPIPEFLDTTSNQPTSTAKRKRSNAPVFEERQKRPRASRVHGNNPRIKGSFVLRPLDTDFSTNLVSHLYSAHLLHREDRTFPTRRWTAWPLRPEYNDVMHDDEHEPTSGYPTTGHPVSERIHRRKRVEYSTLNTSVNDARAVIDGKPWFGGMTDEKDDLKQYLLSFDATSAAAPSQTNPDLTQLHLHNYLHTRTLPLTQNHGGGTRYTSTIDPEEFPYEPLARGIPPFDMDKYRYWDPEENPHTRDPRNLAGFEHARKLVMFELDAAFQREVHARIQAQNEEDKNGHPEPKYVDEYPKITDKIRNSFAKEYEGKPYREKVPIVDPPIRMPQQSLAALMERIDNALVAFGRKANQTRVMDPDSNYDWVRMLQNDVNVGNTLDRCLNLFVRPVEDPRPEMSSDSSDESDADVDDEMRREKLRKKLEARKNLPKKYLHAPLTARKMSRINLMATATPLPYVRPAARVHIPCRKSLKSFDAYSRLRPTEPVYLDTLPSGSNQMFVAGLPAGRPAPTQPVPSNSGQASMGGLAGTGMTGDTDFILSTWGLEPDKFFAWDTARALQGQHILYANRAMQRVKRMRKLQQNTPVLKMADRKLYKRWVKRRARLQKLRSREEDEKIKQEEEGRIKKRPKDPQSKLLDGHIVDSHDQPEVTSASETDNDNEDLPYAQDAFNWNKRIINAIKKSGKPYMTRMKNNKPPRKTFLYYRKKAEAEEAAAKAEAQDQDQDGYKYEDEDEDEEMESDVES